MAKTKTVKQKAWGVFDKGDGKLVYFEDPCLCISTTKLGARIMKESTETVRPVTICWEVEE